MKIACTETEEQARRAATARAAARAARGEERDPNEPKSEEDMLQELSERHRSTNGWFGPDGDVEDHTALSYMIFDLVDRASHSEIYHSGLNWDWIGSD